MQRRSFLAAMIVAFMSAGSVFGLCRKPKPVLEVLVHKLDPYPGMVGGNNTLGVIVGHSEAAESLIRKYLKVAYAAGDRKSSNGELWNPSMLRSWPPLQERETYLIDALKKQGFLVVSIESTEMAECSVAWKTASQDVTIAAKEVNLPGFCEYYQAFTDKFLG